MKQIVFPKFIQNSLPLALIAGLIMAALSIDLFRKNRTGELKGG